MVDIVHRIGLSAPVADVVQAVSSVAGIAGWWTRQMSKTAKAETAMTARFMDQAGQEIGKIRFDITKLDTITATHWRFTDGPAEWIATDATFDVSRLYGYTILGFGLRNWREAVEFTAHCSMK